MNINKFTQKSMQAVQDCEKLAYQYGNQEIDQEHRCAVTSGGQFVCKTDHQDGYSA